MANVISISQARANLPNLVDKVAENLDRYSITVNGQPKAVILSAEELESIEETAEIMSIPGAYKGIMEGSAQAKRGDGMPFDKFLKKRARKK